MGPEFAFNSLDADDDSGEDYDVWGAMWRVQRSF
jgi:hypothetical protein